MIEVKNVTKKYGSFTAIKNISLIANSGEITILLGPNGAGKSTTIKSITGLLQFQGTIHIGEYPNDSLDAKRSFGYVPETPILYDLMTIDEHIKFIGRAYRCLDYNEKAEKYLTLFHLNEKRHKIAKELSKGMRQKVSMMLALIISPKVLLIDEPMIGLDPASIEETLHLLVKLKEEGVAVFVSTHIIDVFTDIWDEAYIMNKGEIVRHVSRRSLENESLKEVFFESVDDAE